MSMSQLMRVVREAPFSGGDRPTPERDADAQAVRGQQPLASVRPMSQLIAGSMRDTPTPNRSSAPPLVEESVDVQSSQHTGSEEGS